MPNGLVALLAGLGGGSSGILEQRERDAVQRARDAALQTAQFQNVLAANEFAARVGPHGGMPMARRVLAALPGGPDASPTPNVPQPSPSRTATMPTPGAGDGGLSALAPAAGAGAMSDGMGGLGGMPGRALSAGGPASRALMSGAAQVGRPAPSGPTPPSAPGTALVAPDQIGLGVGKHGVTAAPTSTGNGSGPQGELTHDEYLRTFAPGANELYDPNNQDTMGGYLNYLNQYHAYLTHHAAHPDLVPEGFLHGQDYVGMGGELAKLATQQREQDLTHGDRLRGQNLEHGDRVVSHGLEAGKLAIDRGRLGLEGQRLDFEQHQGRAMVLVPKLQKDFEGDHDILRAHELSQAVSTGMNAYNALKANPNSGLNDSQLLEAVGSTGHKGVIRGADKKIILDAQSFPDQLRAEYANRTGSGGFFSPQSREYLKDILMRQARSGAQAADVVIQRHGRNAQALGVDPSYVTYNPLKATLDQYKPSRADRMDELVHAGKSLPQAAAIIKQEGY